jgi:GMP synthase-like glutamine amidotransferase
MKAHILQHTATSKAGSTLEWLKKQNIPYSITKFFEPHPSLPELPDFDMLIICGGEMNVDEENSYPWMRAEKDFIKNALVQNKKMVGLCLGGQLIAEALGAPVGRHKNWEVGWLPVQLKKISPLLPDLDQLTVFQFHGDSFGIPAGAQKFAQSEACENQGFTWGSHVVAMQFHPESTKDWVIECSQEKLPSGPFVQTAEQMVLGNRHQDALKDWYFKLLTEILKS